MRTPLVHPNFLAGLVALLTVTLTAASVVTVPPEPPTVIAKILLRTTFSGDVTKEAIIASAEFPPGAMTGRHTHPGDEYATVLEGTLQLQVDGQPPRHIVAGESYHNARNIFHETRNASSTTVRVISTFIIDKGQPLMKPAD